MFRHCSILQTTVISQIEKKKNIYMTSSGNVSSETLPRKIGKTFGEHIDAESFTSAVLLISHGVRKPPAGVENPSISWGEINRMQWRL